MNALLGTRDSNGSPMPVYDGTFAIEKLTENDFGGELVESIEPPVEEGIE